MTSNCAKATFLMFALLLISAPVAAQDTVEFMVNWTANPEPDVTKYLVYRSLSPDDGFELIDSVNATATPYYVDSGIAEGSRFYYRVKAKNSNGDVSGLSAPVSGITIPNGADEATKSICRISSFRKTDEGVYDVTWITADPTNGFLIYDSDDESLDLNSQWDDGGYQTTHTVQVSSLDEADLYYFRAVSYDENKNMAISTIEELEIDNEDPAPPSVVQDLNIYPVPFNPSMGNMVIDGMPAGGSVAIYNESGLEVWSRDDVEASSTISWNGTNRRGSPVASGVYYVMVKRAGGEVVSKNPIIVVH